MNHEFEIEPIHGEDPPMGWTMVCPGCHLRAELPGLTHDQAQAWAERFHAHDVILNQETVSDRT